MMKNNYEQAIENIPKFFETQMNLDKSKTEVFNVLKSIIDFDFGYIFFLNPDSIQLKYKSDENDCFDINDVVFFDQNIKKKLFSHDDIIFNGENEIAKLLNLDSEKSFILSKLVIRHTSYGFILLCKNESEFYKDEHLKILKACSSIISYNIKDIELSNVFKIQLKALKDSILETNSAYKTIKEQNIKILESDKVKNEFLANISHELRTPLNAIIGFSEVLSANLFGPLNDKQSEYVNDIYVSGIHLLGMINEILDISKIESNAMTINYSKFSISRAINEVVNVIKPLAIKKSINIDAKIFKDGEVTADFQKIKQILYNLLSNAIKFTNNDGKISLNVDFSPTEFIIKISDNGIGIDKKYHGKIFAKFVQLDSAYTKKESSTGLGLTITKELVEMHGGEISVKSEVGQGTTFVVKIPLIEENNV